MTLYNLGCDACSASADGPTVRKRQRQPCPTEHGCPHALVLRQELEAAAAELEAAQAATAAAAAAGDEAESGLEAQLRDALAEAARLQACLKPYLEPLPLRLECNEQCTFVSGQENGTAPHPGCTRETLPTRLSAGASERVWCEHPG